ncbi:MAG: polyprenyl synthetase family protein [Thermomicrobiales bacterium]
MGGTTTAHTDIRISAADSSADLGGGNWLDALLEPEIERALGELSSEAPLLSLMVRYHLGLVDSTGQPLADNDRRAVQGKRIRPLLAVLACMASGGAPEIAVPLATGIEFLHNFTLVHDDIQDRSPNRRHRATVWRIWGDAQAINAGDALFAASNLAVLATPPDAVPPPTIHRLTAEFNRMTIAIVGGQVRDLDFEGKDHIAPEAYLEMITGKTAAILRYAAWAGSIVGGADDEKAEVFARMGLALGVGFQIRDDLLGIWGAREETGKEVADDIRRRKQSLPILLLRAQATPEETETLDALYAGDEIDEAGVATVLALLEAHGIRQQVLDQVESAHQDAISALASIGSADANDGLVAIARLIERMRVRSS